MNYNDAMGYQVKRTDANQQEVMDYLRKEGFTVWDTHELGGGFPDIVVGCEDGNVLVEIKQPGGKLNEKEQNFFDTWKGYKTIAYSGEDAYCKIRMILGIRG